jgi:uncharacterized small protein (DUF1192 family)
MQLLVAVIPSGGIVTKAYKNGEQAPRPNRPSVANPARGSNSVRTIHHRIGELHAEIERWERQRGAYDWQEDAAGFEKRWRLLIDQLCGTPAADVAEAVIKLERAIDEGGQGSPDGDRLIESALADLRRFRG